MAYPNVKYKTYTDIVDKDGGNVISYLDSSSTIDFNNKNVINFTGGGSGGGDTFLNANQTFTGINTFANNTILAGVNSGALTSSGVITGASLETTGNVECGKVECVGNVEIATGDLEVSSGQATIAGNLSSNGITNTGDISTTTQTTLSNHIIGGDCVVTGQIVGNGGLSINSGSSSVGAISTNNITTTGTISCNSSVAGASLAAQAGDITCPAGNVSGLSLQSNGGQVNLKTGNARIESDVNDDTRIQANANTDTIVFRLGGTGADHLQLSFDSVSNKSVLKLYDFGASPPQYYDVGQNPDDLALLLTNLQNTSLTFNGSTTGTFEGSLVSTGTTTLSGTTINLGTGVNTATITCMNDTADRLNINTGKVQLDATAELRKTGSVSGATDIFTSTDSIIDRSISSFTPTLFNLVTTTPGAGEIQLASGITNSVQGSVQVVRFGTNGGTAVYRVTCRGRLSGFSVNNIGAGSGSIDLFTLPTGYRPPVELNRIAQGHPDDKQVRIDISTSGLVSIAEGASSNLASFCNLGSIDFYAGQ